MASTSEVVEPLLRENPQRYVMFPIEDQEIFDMYKKQLDLYNINYEIEEFYKYKDYDIGDFSYTVGIYSGLCGW